MKNKKEKILFFTNELAIMLKSGLTFTTAIEIILKEEKDKNFKEILKKIHKNLITGKSIFESFKNYDKVFGNTYLYMLKIGEVSGSITERLEDISKSLEFDVADFGAQDILGWLMNDTRSGYHGKALNHLLSRADFIATHDDVQRDILLGALAGAGRVNAPVYDDDPSLNALVRTDPVGDVVVAFAHRPLCAADITADSSDGAAHPPKPNDFQLAVQYLRDGGIKEVTQRAAGRIRRMTSR